MNIIKTTCISIFIYDKLLYKVKFVYLLDEVKHQDNSVSFQLSRQKGLYGKVEVFWSITSRTDSVNVTHQVYPTEGTVVFEESVNSMSITLIIKADMVKFVKKFFFFYSSTVKYKISLYSLFSLFPVFTLTYIGFSLETTLSVQKFPVLWSYSLYTKSQKLPTSKFLFMLYSEFSKGRTLFINIIILKILCLLIPFNCKIIYCFLFFFPAP